MAPPLSTINELDEPELTPSRLQSLADAKPVPFFAHWQPANDEEQQEAIKHQTPAPQDNDECAIYDDDDDDDFTLHPDTNPLPIFQISRSNSLSDDDVTSTGPLRNNIPTSEAAKRGRREPTPSPCDPKTPKTFPSAKLLARLDHLIHHPPPERPNTSPTFNPRIIISSPTPRPGSFDSWRTTSSADSTDQHPDPHTRHQAALDFQATVEVDRRDWLTARGLCSDPGINPDGTLSESLKSLIQDRAARSVDPPAPSPVPVTFGLSPPTCIPNPIIGDLPLYHGAWQDQQIRFPAWPKTQYLSATPPGAARKHKLITASLLESDKNFKAERVFGDIAEREWEENISSMTKRSLLEWGRVEPKPVRPAREGASWPIDICDEGVRIARKRLRHELRMIMEGGGSGKWELGHILANDKKRGVKADDIPM